MRGARSAVACLTIVALSAVPGVAPAARSQAVRGQAAPDTLDLRRAIRTALLRNPGIASAEASAATAAADRWAHWGALLPSASANASIGSSSSTTLTFLEPDGSRTVLEDPVITDTRSNSMGLSLNLSLGAETFTTIDAGGERRAAADYGVSSAQALVVREVKVAYFEALKRQRLVDVARRQVAGRRDEYDLTRDKYDIAAASRSDLLGAEISLRNAELQLMEDEDALDAAVRAVRVAQGVDDLAVEDLTLVDPESVPSAESLDVQTLLEAARMANPQLRRLAAEERAASTDVWGARSSYLPRLNASLSFGRGRQLAADESYFEFSPANKSSSFSLSLSLPLFDGFQRRQRNASASNALATARANLREQELNVERQIRDRVADIHRGERRLGVLERNAELAAERLDLTREQYRIGTVEYLNLQRAIEDLDTAEQQAFEQRYELLKRWAELEELAGGLPSENAR